MLRGIILSVQDMVRKISRDLSRGSSLTEKVVLVIAFEIFCRDYEAMMISVRFGVVRNRSNQNLRSKRRSIFVIVSLKIHSRALVRFMKKIFAI